jgi:drug/metabolite transporter (DMT)-like permease
MPARLGVLLAIVFWGVSFVATKVVVGEISPITLVFTRSALGALLLFGLAGLRRRLRLPPRDAWPKLAAMGFVGVAFHGLLQAVALTMTSASDTGWLIGLTPIWSALLAALLLKERFGTVKTTGLLVGFLGAVVVITRGGETLRLLALPSTRGDLLILASTLNWAFYSVLGHPTIRRLGPLRATANAMLSGALLLVPPFVAVAGWRDYLRLDRAGWTALLFLGIACSGLGYYFWFRALERIEASRVAAFLYLEPLVTLGAAVALLGERVGAVTVAGGLLLLAGVVLVQSAGRAPAVQPATSKP